MRLNKSQQNKFRIASFIADWLSLNVALILVLFLLGNYGYANVNEKEDIWQLVLLNVLYIPSFLIFELPVYRKTVREEIIIERTLYTLITHVILVLIADFILGFHLPKRSIVMGYFFISLIFISTQRLTFRHTLKNMIIQGDIQRDVVIIGNTLNANELAKVFTNATYGYRSVTQLNDNDDVIAWLEKHKGTNELYSAIPANEKDRIRQIYRYCMKNCIRFYAVSNYQSLINHSMQLQYKGGVAVLSLRNEPLRKTYNKIIKRVFDIVISSIYLVTLHPIIFIIVATIIKLTSKGPIHFKQERSGMNGKTFTIYKFRSMLVNDEADTKQATADDKRKTKFGEFIRKTNIDELPQFINVWKGEMSIVGPRPHMLKHTEQYSKLIDEYMVRHFVKPGITGWAQITGFRGETPHLSDMEGRVKQDIWYIENWSLWLDFRIILITFFDTLTGEKKGA